MSDQAALKLGMAVYTIRGLFQIPPCRSALMRRCALRSVAFCALLGAMQMMKRTRRDPHDQSVWVEEGFITKRQNSGPGVSAFASPSS